MVGCPSLFKAGGYEQTSITKNTVHQAAVADGELEQAVLACRALATDYIEDASASALDLSAVLRLLAKVRSSCRTSDYSNALDIHCASIPRRSSLGVA